MRTVDVLRDRLAELMGFARESGRYTDMWIGPNDEVSFSHPVPLTLDFIAKALPEGWEWCNIAVVWSNCHPESPRLWVVYAGLPAKKSVHGNAETEFHARLACVVEAREYVKGAGAPC